MILNIRIIIAILLFFMAVDDFKTKSINSFALKIVLVLQMMCCFLNIKNGNVEGLEYRAVASLILLFLYYMIFDLRKFIGDGDIWFISFQLVSLTLKLFILFWFSYLVFAIIIAVYFKIKKHKEIPLFPTFFLAELLVIWSLV